MPGRTTASGSYRYGFNGKEQDNEAKGTGAQYDYGMRIYDPRLGRFLSVDPLTYKFPELTSYQFASNTPIQAVDLDGAESMFGWSIGLTPKQTAATADSWNKHNNKITNGTASGVKKSVTKTWSFLTSDMWKAQTWQNAAGFVEESIFDMSTVKVTPSPNLDAKAKDFKDNVINGDSYTRSEYFSEFGTDLFTGYIGSKGIGSMKSLAVAKYMSGTFTIGSKTLAKVSAHLEQFGVRAENTIMLDRMKKIAAKEMKATEIDINFAKHELRESELMKKGMNYEQAHESVLKEQGMYHRGYEKKLYTEDALKAGNEQIEREAKGGK